MAVIYVKNMVCDRCKSVLKNELEDLGFSVVKVDLGKIELNDFSTSKMPLIKGVIERNGFALVNSATEIAVEKVKALLINVIEEKGSLKESLSVYIANKLNKEYSMVSKLFSGSQGITIEKYFIRLKIEKAKEAIQMGTSNFSGIAYDLDYKNSSHLASQFKAITGMSMSTYKKLQNWNRKPLDKIV